KSNTLIVDSTHTTSRYQHKTANEYLQEKAKAVSRVVYQNDEPVKEKFRSTLTSSDINDEISYCKQIIQTVESEMKYADIQAVQEKLKVSKETVEDLSTELSYSADEGARFGYKSSDSSFFGYKTHLAISDERIITAAVITTGEKNDGKYLQELITKSEETGIKVNTVVGDTAYSSRENIKYTKGEGIDLVSKLHPIVSNGSC